MKFTKIPNLLKNRRAVNAVISNLILIGAVIAVGFAVLFWSQSQAISYNNQYSAAVRSDTEQLRERIVFEYIHYDGSLNILRVFLMNSGTVDKISIANVYVNGIRYDPPLLSFLSGGQIVENHLNRTQEGCFAISPSPSLDLGKNYPIIIVTGRGSSFAASFAT